MVASDLADAGVRKAFGVPGGEVLSLMLELRSADVEFVLCRHESAAGMAASAYGKLTGAPGLAISTLGPGASNLLLPIANAQLDREALIGICGELPASYPRVHTHQRMPLLDIFRPITKVCEPLKPGTARDAVRRAVAAATGPPPGSVILTLSSDDAAADAAEGGAPISEPTTGGVHPEEAARAVADRMRAARHPLVVVGLEVPTAAAGQLRRWLQRWELPFAVTPKAKGGVDEGDPRFVGVLDGAGLLDVMRDAIAASDLVVGVGLDQVELIQTWHTSAPMVWLREPGKLDAAPRAHDLVQAPIAAVLDLLQENDAPARWEDAFGETRERRRQASEAPGAPTWIPAAVRAAAPADTILATDVGSHKCLFSQYWPADPAGAFLTSNGLSAMGYGLPAAIGAKLARPQQPVLAVVGDGGFAMTGPELETAIRANAPVVVIVLVDGSLSLIRALERRRGLPNYGVDFGAVDVCKVAEGYGATAVMASSPEQLSAAVSNGLRASSPTVVVVPLDPDSYAAIL